jgi:vancomycin resistance protein YoaR
LASSRFKGVLLAPGEVFSFNKVLGDVSTLTGYRQAYIIKEGRTVLGDGGGVCQVSSTLFRAALNVGLPIVERKAHSYRVSYYEQNSPVGLDATVYDPTADLKIKNDTPAHILIQPQVNPKNSQLIFEIYGTNDGRVSKISKPTISNLTPPPEDLYQDDPSLPAGTLKQIDWKAWGAKVTYTYNVSRDGETIFQKTFVSNYQPWQAVYLRGTASQ